jgi:hypothetical protein
MRSVFAIAPLAIMLAWLNPHTGSRGMGLAGAPSSPSPAWAMTDSPSDRPAAALSSPLVAFDGDSASKREAGAPGGPDRPRSVPGNLLVNAAVVR